MTFRNPRIVPSTRPHFNCKSCDQGVWREGGIATAKIHGRDVHGKREFNVDRDFELTTMKPTFYRGPAGRPMDSRKRRTDGWSVSEGN